MLVIGRGEKQSICIGDNVEVFIEKIYEYNGKLYVKLSIDAPREVKIVRKELKTEESENINESVESKKG